MFVVRLVVLAAVGCGSSAPPSSATAPPHSPPIDLVVTNGKVFTAVPGSPWAEALAIRGDRIVAVGTTVEIRALAAGAIEIDAGGRVVIPGINDAHVHAPDVWKPHVVHLAGEPTLDETVAAARAAAGEVPSGTWIAVPLGEASLDDPRATRASLDAAAPAHPVMASDRAGHAKLLNSMALQELGIADGAADPPHGRYGRDSRTQRLNGWIYEYAAYHAMRRLDEAQPDAVVAAATAQHERDVLAFGVTSLQTFAVIDAARFARIQSTRRPLVRWRIIRFPPTQILSRFEPIASTPRTRVSGVKYILDGTPRERGAWRAKPYADRPALRGQGNFTADELARIVEIADTTGEPLLLHAVGDAAVEHVVAAIERRGGPERWRSHRVRIEHGDAATQAQLRRAAALGVILVQNPVHFLNADVISKRMGDCGGTCQLLASAEKAGVTIALGSDGPPNPFLGIMAATTHPVSPREALTREQAVIAYTRGAAYAETMEHEKGTLAAGMLADVAILSADVFTVPAEQLPATTAWMTIVGGEIVHDARKR